ncbi:MAG TPA: metal-dependent hydrolase [Saprospiraceae bacterium]|nr:metal-dependent hydrolase [Saprospiraceae bacterium]HMQ82121.1 metal-dependent hydrolase [Saprospiraceae bacterium]
MTLTYYGHSCFLLETRGKCLLFDPFISHNSAAAHINIADIKADYILISHGHGDHVADVEAIGKPQNAQLIGAFEVISWFQQKGMQGIGMNLGGKAHFDFGTVKMVSAIHTSGLPDGSYGGNPGGFVIWNEEGCLYFAGDTALILDMQLIPKTCPKLDLAIFPIGDHYTMGYEDAALAAQLVQCDRVVGCHYDTFPPIKIDKMAAQKAFAASGKTLLLPSIGEQVAVK